jgi:hypothetical protein
MKTSFQNFSERHQSERLGTILLLTVWSTLVPFAATERPALAEEAGAMSVCFRDVEGLRFYYGLIDGQWQALRDFDPSEHRVVDCDAFYGEDAASFSDAP